MSENNNNLNINDLLNGISGETLGNLEIKKYVWRESLKYPSKAFEYCFYAVLAIIFVCAMVSHFDPNSYENRYARMQAMPMPKAPELFVSPLGGQGFDHTTGTFLYYATADGLKANPQNYGKIVEYQGNDGIKYKVNFQRAWSRKDFGIQ